MNKDIIKIKVFLATTNDLHEESVEMADLIENLNYILERNDVHVYLTKWDYLEDEISPEQKSLQYDKILGESDICIIAFGKEFGSYKEEELKRAFDKVCLKDINPKKLFVYFKNVKDISEDLETFRDSFPDQYFKHFTGKFSDSNSLRASFLIEFHRFQTDFLQNNYPLNIENSKIRLNNQDILVTFNSLPFVSNYDHLNKINSNIANLELLFKCGLTPDNPLYPKKKKEYNQYLEEKKTIESKLWNTAIMLSGYKEQGISEKLKEAIEYFEEGKIELVREILEKEEKKNNYKLTINELKKVRKDKEKILNDLVDTVNKEEKKKEELKESIRRKELLINTEEIQIKEGWGERVINLHEEIIEITKEVYGEYSEEYIIKLCEASGDNRTHGKYERGLKLSKKALEIISSFNNFDIVLKGIVYNNLALCYNKNRDYKKNLKYSLLHFEIIEKNLKEDYFEYVKSLNNLGLVYNDLEEYDKALSKLLEGEKIFKKYLDSDSNLVFKAILYSNIGETNRGLKNYDNALRYHLKAKNIIEKKYGKKHYLLGRCYHNLAQIFDDNNLNLKEKEKLYLVKAIDTYNKTLGENHEYTAFALRDLGDWYHRNNDYKKALRLKKKSLICLIKTYGYSYIEIARAYNSIAYTYDEYNLKDKALGYLKKALDVFNYIPKDNIYYPQYLKNIGYEYKELGNMEESIKFYKMACTIYKKMYGEQNATTIEVFEELASAYGWDGKYDLAKKYVLKALNFKKKLLPLSHFSINESYVDLGSISRKLKDFREALKYRKLSLDWHIQNSGKKSEETAQAFNNVGAQYRDLNEYSKAIEYIWKAYEISKEINRTEDQGVYLNRLGRVYALMGDKETAKSKFEEALRLLPEDHPEAIDTRRRLEKLGNNDLKESAQ